MALTKAPADSERLDALITARWERPLSRQLEAIAGRVRAQAAETAGVDPDTGVAAVLGYGSCLRDVSPADGLADFYVLMADGMPVSTSRFARLGCRIAAPNVYYAECDHEGTRLRAKFAVLPLRQFEARVSRRTENPYFWARFAQPCALLSCREDARERVFGAVRTAVVTMLQQSLLLCDGKARLDDVWLTGLQATYGTELRSESGARAGAIMAADPDWYRGTAEAVLGNDMGKALSRVSDADWARGVSAWKRRRLRGKLLSVLRLAKAAFTFRGGADYLAWKLERHSGVAIELSGWQRRHPILASLWLMPKLYLKGAFR
ncbi:MAG: hypothetical protein AAF441_08225 [Pseudomonadota bacterium]